MRRIESKKAYFQISMSDPQSVKIFYNLQNLKAVITTNAFWHWTLFQDTVKELSTFHSNMKRVYEK